MLGQLLESAPRRVRTRYSIIVSVIGHAAVMSGAVAAARPVSDAVEPEPVVTWHPPVPPPPPPCEECVSRSGRGSPGRVEFPTLPFPLQTPGEIAIDVSESVDPPDRDILISGEDWRRSTTPERTGRAGSPGGQAFVDREVVPLPTNPVPRYPAELRDARIEGKVLARFLVDTSGRVTMESVVIDATDHPAFGDAVIETLRRSRFEPAEYRGRKVPQLVSRAFVFVLRE